MTVGRAEVFIQRGRIVRALATYGGTAMKDELFEAMADAGIFNSRHPDIAIPRAYAMLGFYPRTCDGCKGEGVVARDTTYRDGEISIGAIICSSCSGAGFDGIVGYGEHARLKVAPLSTLPR